ncbi:MAG TPA: PAS domain-containing sensor histidine kinase [Anaeromyxobacteraceae bacterium]|nr:PAS domain-containing sensor histidine kinase [Anaeromyxobacteraceae bacterium]
MDLEQAAEPRRAQAGDAPAGEWWTEALAGGGAAAWAWDGPNVAFRAAGAFEPLLGAAPRSLADLDALVHEEDRPPREAALSRALAAGGAWCCAFRPARGPDGAWIEERGSVERGATGDVRVTALLVDVTRRKADEAALEQRLRREHRERRAAEAATEMAEGALRALARSEASLESIFSSMADGVVLFASDGRITRTNPAARDMLGFAEARPDEPFAARALRLGLHDVEGRAIPADELPVPRALRGQVTRGLPIGVRLPEGRVLWLSAGAAPIRAPDGAVVGAVLTLSDMSRLRELQEQREDLSRMIAHDLRSPLGAIVAQAKLLARRNEQAATVRSRAEAIAASAQRMAAMLSDLVESALIESGRLRLDLEQVDLPAMARELPSRLPSGGERIRVEAERGLPRVPADPARLERVLVNLFTNALKYSEPGSAVLVRVARDGGEIVLEVEDRGQGIAPEDLPHLFERYYRALGSARFEGVGLGLWTARRLVEAHGGSIGVTTVAGRGSVFRVRLPAASAGP